MLPRRAPSDLSLKESAGSLSITARLAALNSFFLETAFSGCRSLS